MVQKFLRWNMSCAIPGHNSRNTLTILGQYMDGHKHTVPPLSHIRVSWDPKYSDHPGTVHEWAHAHCPLPTVNLYPAWDVVSWDTVMGVGSAHPCIVPGLISEWCGVVRVWNLFVITIWLSKDHQFVWQVGAVSICPSLYQEWCILRSQDTLTNTFIDALQNVI